jgi:hypothetical protein
MKLSLDCVFHAAQISTPMRTEGADDLPPLIFHEDKAMPALTLLEMKFADNAVKIAI